VIFWEKIILIIARNEFKINKNIFQRKKKIWFPKFYVSFCWYKKGRVLFLSSFAIWKKICCLQNNCKIFVYLTCINRTPCLFRAQKAGPKEVWFRQVALYVYVLQLSILMITPSSNKKGFLSIIKILWQVFYEYDINFLCALINSSHNILIIETLFYLKREWSLELITILFCVMLSIIKILWLEFIMTQNSIIINSNDHSLFK
jgi:hypothetical protein